MKKEDFGKGVREFIDCEEHNRKNKLRRHNQKMQMEEFE